jgi:signal transduction histidine kinase/ligand-binding sensor domain-containing protein
MAPLSRAAQFSNAMFTRVWHSQDGMPGNEVTGISQDGSGYLWISYLNGLAKFDGLNFHAVPLPLPPEYGFNIRVLLRTSGDKFWLALDGGTVICISPGKTNVLTSENGIPEGRPVSMVQSRNGAIWISFSNGSLCSIEGEHVRRIDTRSGLAKLATDNLGQVWFAQAGRVGVWREKQNRFENLLSLPAQHIRLARARNGGIWICADSKLFSYSQSGALVEKLVVPMDNSLAAPEILFEDRSGAVWVGTFGSGLFRCSGTNAEPVETSQRTILSLFEDREGSLWAGTAGGGLNRVRPRVLDLHDTESGLPFDSARSICVDSQNRVWAAGRNGALARLDNGKWHLFDSDDGWPGKVATCLTTDSKGAVWIGTYRRGILYRWENGSFTKLDRDDGLAGNIVRLLFCDRSGALWIGLASPNCLQRLADGKLQRFDTPRGEAIDAAAQDTNGNLWFATVNGTLLRVEGDRLVDETHLALSPTRSITCLQTTSDGSLWIGYLGAGVGRLNGKKFGHITPENGLPDGHIWDIMPDNRGWFWFSTDQGILRVSAAAMNSVANGKTAHLDAIYHGSDELLSLQGFSPYFPGAAHGPDGNILFPLLTGMAVVHPDRFSPDSKPPQVIIESAEIDDKPFLLPKNDSVLEIAPGPRKVGFQFTAPSFVAPASLRFRDKLEGLDKDWVDLGTQRRVTYTRLPPGRYSFHVTACNYEGKWNEVGDEISFEIRPFFWQTLTFKILFAALIPVGLFGLARYVSARRYRRELLRLQQEAALNRERARIAKDIHDDLGASLTQISLLSELASRNLRPKDSMTHPIGKLAETARQAFASLDEIVWAVNPRNDTLANLLDYLAQFALDFLSATHIRCRLDFPTRPPEQSVPSQTRHTLYLVTREALNNVVKHARASEIHLHADVTDNTLRLTIEDDGIGFEFPANKPEADGLANMRQRLNDIGGKFELASNPGSGTKIFIEIPLRKMTANLNLETADIHE